MRFHKLEECLRSAFGRSTLSPGNGTADFAEVISESQKFYVGDVCLLEKIPMANDIPRLPYPLCCFEFRESAITETENPAGDLVGMTSSFFVVAEELGEYDKQYSDIVRTLLFMPLPMPNMQDRLWVNVGHLHLYRNTGKYNCILNKNTIKIFNGIADESYLEESVYSATQWLFRFLSVLNCSNIEVTETAAPLALNKKRLAKRKVPIYSYKTLVVKGAQKRFLSAANGTHEAPRIHLRRGHIKRRKTGNFWWEPCVVGDKKKGVVMKDYRADGIAKAN